MHNIIILTLLASSVTGLINKPQWFSHYRGGAKSAKKVPCVGIDLGTTYRSLYPSTETFYLSNLNLSCAAVWKNGRVEICPNDQGNRITPSYVAWDSSGQRIVGDAAKNQAASNPSNTVFDVKRLIGRKFSDPIVQNDIKLFPFKGNAWIFPVPRMIVFSATSLRRQTGC
jgi:heat shock 70kDa protein 1/2/6/8